MIAADPGFTIHPDIYSTEEINDIITIIDKSGHNNTNFRRNSTPYAIRNFISAFPQLIPILFNRQLIELISTKFGRGYFISKSIYFDKPPNANWFVAYHQDITISVDKKVKMPGFNSWTVKHEQFSVQPPVSILENNFTVRIHLDDTTDNNGALRVIPGSHLKGISRTDKINCISDGEVICNVPRGGVMLMRPLLLHASGKSTSQSRRRVIQIEFSKQELPEPLQWSEKYIPENMSDFDVV